MTDMGGDNSAIMTIGKCVVARGNTGMIDASQTHNFHIHYSTRAVHD